MLVPFIYAVPGKMLDGYGHSLLLSPFDISRAHALHPLRVAAEGSRIGNRIAKVKIHVDDGRESVVRANAASFQGANPPQLVGKLRVVGGGNRQIRADFRAVLRNALAAGFQIGRDQQRDWGGRLQRGNRSHHAVLIHRTAHQPADADFPGQSF
ncbi:hypothetical protein D3C76_1347690 [compost metagenome]